jgi:hypothetical protein
MVSVGFSSKTEGAMDLNICCRILGCGVGRNNFA